MTEQRQRRPSEDSLEDDLPTGDQLVIQDDDDEEEAKDTPAGIVGSPSARGSHFLMPSPIPTRRTRTVSQSERAARGPSFSGKVKEFCRQKGFGLISPSDGSEPIFVHISDVEGEFVPREGDEVTFKKCLVPPKNEKFSAVHVKITHMSEGTHDRWEAYTAHGTP